MPKLRFAKRVVAEVRNEGQINTFHAVGDINGDGRPDIVVSGRNGRLVWLENTGERTPWPEHFVDDAANMECGGCLVDLTGDGRLDIVNGGDAGADEIWWWENPGSSGGRWRKRLIAKTGRRQFHDTLIADPVGDRRRCLLFTNQRGPGGTAVFCVPLPQDPMQSPWPGLEEIASGKGIPNPQNTALADGIQPEEGLAVGDVDGDGLPEAVCGRWWFKSWTGRAKGWAEHQFAEGYMTTKVAMADLDGDGRNEMVLAEGDPCVYGHPEGGKLAWFKAPRHPAEMWEEHVLAEGLMDAHSLQVADLHGTGRPDIFVGEIGCAATFAERPPKLAVWENLGGRFRRSVIDIGTGTHDALLVDMDGDGRPDIVGKALQGPERYNVHVWYNRTGLA